MAALSLQAWTSDTDGGIEANNTPVDSIDASRNSDCLEIKAVVSRHSGS